MDNMNKSSEGGEGNLLCVDDEMDPSQNSKMMKSSYVGESSRPIRARVREHITNLRCGSSKSFIISHWMDKHSASIEAPVFKWEILASYTDALRRQLGEGLYIMEAGGLNRRDEFNHNLICRMSPVMNEPMSEKELKSELERKRLYRDRLKMFIVDMSRKSNVMDKMKIQQKKCMEMMLMICYVPDQFHLTLTRHLLSTRREGEITWIHLHLSMSEEKLNC